MKSLKLNIQFTFFVIIGFFALLAVLLGFYEVKYNIIQRAQRQVLSDLRVARWAYDTEIERIRFAFNLVSPDENLEVLKRKIGLDYLYIVKKEDRKNVVSEVVRAAFKGVPVAGTRIIGEDELKRMGPGLYKKAAISIKSTPKSRATQKRILESAMAVGYAKPIFDERGEVKSVMYGGKIINRDFPLVDKIRDFVFENKLYGKKPIGTVTIFLDDVRIATNVLDTKGERAIGTRVSESVYKKVVEEGRLWLDRAFVVTDWYLTAYEPIRNIDGKVIGILYVGTLEKPFLDMQRNIFLVFLAIVILSSGLAALFSIVLARGVTKPLTRFLMATNRLSKGDLDHRIEELDGNIGELHLLADSFNEMATRLKDREKSYLDLISFVAHELKAILASTMLNAYTVRDGFLGMVNFKQRKALDSVVRNLDYFSSTVKNFLELSRIEKGEMNLNLAEVNLKEDIFDAAVDSFIKQAEENEITITDEIPVHVKIKADRDLLLIAANNLVGNAVKYGIRGGKILIKCSCMDKNVRVEVYGDGKPIDDAQKSMLFKKFSRLDTPETKKVRGTGLGLFITKEIIERHKGKIWVEAKSNGNSFIFEINKEG